MTGGRGPDACIDAVGMEAHDGARPGLYDRAKHAVGLETDRPIVLRQAITRVPQGRHGLDPRRLRRRRSTTSRSARRSPRALTLKMGQTHVHKYMRPLLRPHPRRRRSTRRSSSRTACGLDDAPDGYAMFLDKEDDCIKVVMRP